MQVEDLFRFTTRLMTFLPTSMNCIEPLNKSERIQFFFKTGNRTRSTCRKTCLWNFAVLRKKTSRYSDKIYRKSVVTLLWRRRSVKSWSLCRWSCKLAFRQSSMERQVLARLVLSVISLKWSRERCLLWMCTLEERKKASSTGFSKSKSLTSIAQKICRSRRLNFLKWSKLTAIRRLSIVLMKLSRQSKMPGKRG